MISNKYIVPFFLFLFSSCAQFINITGGEQDTTPPRLIEEETFPQNRSINFASKEIKLTFDEYFTVTNPNQKVTVSPSLENDLDYVLKGKVLTIKLNNELEPNTTYTLNFGDAIKDYNANNTLKNFTYVFSTGGFIDSMRVTGKVIEAKSNVALEDIMVGLYKSFDDSIVSKEKPFYFTRTDKQGYFTLENIKNGSYKIFALKDENRNLLFDLPNEQVAYQEELIVIDTSNSDKNELRLFEQNHKKQKITSKTFDYPGKLTITFEKPNDSINTQFINKNIGLLSSVFSKERDTAIYWLSNSPNERFKAIIQYDSLVDTISINPFKRPKTGDTSILIEKLSTSLLVSEPILISLNRPIERFDSSLISIKKDSTLITISNIAIDTFNKQTLQVYFPKKHAEKYELLILPKAIKGIYETTIQDTIKRIVSTYEKDFFGALTLQLENTSDTIDYILSLKQGKTSIKTVLVKSNKHTFSNLPPGKYQFELLIDENKNGKWDTGNYYSKIQPETILLYDQQIEVRSNWELSEKWDIKKK